ncbi:MAG TPA: amino acid permease [Gemmatimonadaceae bacterium]|nr:amino acid permease [Gemmatimonadaceae bacterium]
MRRWDLVALIINNVIGAGIFGLPAALYLLAGTYSLLAFIACAFVIGIVALVFAEMSTRFTETGGPYLYARKTLGPLVGFEVGWLNWIARLTGFAGVCNLFLIYLALFVPGANEGALRVALIVAVVGVYTTINLVGIREMTIVSNIFAVSKLIPLVLFITIGLFFIDSSRFSFAEPPDYQPFSKAVLLLVFAFSFEASMIPAGEVRNPARDYPRALLISLSIVAVVYVLVQVVSIGTLPGLATSDRPLADAAGVFLGSTGAYLITIGALISTSGTLNAGILFTSRVPFALAEQGQLPSALARIHPRFRTPHVAILLSASVILVLTIFNTFITAATISAMVRLSLYIITAICLIVLRRRGDKPAPAFQVPGGLFIPVLTIALSCWLLSNSSAREARDAGLAALVGLALYGLTKLRYRG